MATKTEVAMCKGTNSEILRLVEVLVEPPQIVVPYLWGQPGIGKSTMIRTMAKQAAKRFNCEFLYVDLRLALLESTDLMGLPVPTGDVTRFLAPRMLPRKGDKTKGILFLDELNRAREDTINAAFQLILDRKVGEYELPEGWSIVVAGNLGDEDMTIVRDMDSALWNRMFHFKIDPSFDEWKYFMRNGGEDAPMKGEYIETFPAGKIKDDAIVRFLETNRKFWISEPSLGPWGSPRIWDKLQQVICRIGGSGKQNLDNIFQFAVSAAGNTSAIALRKWLEEQKSLRPEDVLRDLPRYEAEIRKYGEEKRDELYQLCEGIADLVVQKKEKVNDVEYKNLCKLICDILDRDHAIAISRKLAYEKAPVIDKLCKEKKFGAIIAEVLKEKDNKGKDVVKK